MKHITWQILVLSCTISTFAAAPQAHAQGGAFGANRRVTAAGGYGAVKGTFGEPTFTITQRQVPNRTHPDLYLGIRGRGAVGDIVTDSGVTFSQFQETDRITHTRYRLQTWWGFSRVTGGGGSGGQDPVRRAPINGVLQDQWRVHKGSLGSVDVEASLRPNGSYQLSITHGGTTYFQTDTIQWPMRNGRIDGGVVTGMTVRRVVAATQDPNPAGGPHYDGFSMTDASFSGGEVARLTQDAAGNLVVGAFGNWRDATGLDDEFLPFGRNAGPTGEPTGPWVIDMDSPHDRDNNGVPRDRANLYESETVNINLNLGGRPTRARGRALRRGERAYDAH